MCGSGSIILNGHTGVGSAGTWVVDRQVDTLILRESAGQDNVLHEPDVMNLDGFGSQP